MRAYLLVSLALLGFNEIFGTRPLGIHVPVVSLSSYHRTPLDKHHAPF